MIYRYEILDPRPTPEAKAHNDAICSPEAILKAGVGVYGIEVTVPAFAERCAMNLDPQHSGGDTTVSAIEAATAWGLPPKGAVLATIRADADSVGAMAVLTIRRRRWAELDDRLGYEDCLIDWPRRDGGLNEGNRILIIGEADREASGPWPGPRWTDNPDELVGPVAGIAGLAMDHTVPLAKRVEEVAHWIASGRSDIVEGYRCRALEEARDALQDLQVDDIAGTDVVAVTGAHRLAFGIGYRLAPVVVATNPEFRWQDGAPHRKHTIARWNSAVPMYWDSMLDELRRRDPGPLVTLPDGTQARSGWGGSSSIVGSPQGTGSVLATDEVVDIACRYRRLAVSEARLVAAGRAWVAEHPTSWSDFGGELHQPSTDTGRALAAALERADDEWFGISGASFGSILRQVLRPRSG